MPQLLDSNFHRAVVLVVHHDDDGTFGVVLNRPAQVTAEALCASLGIDWGGDPDTGVSWGGPVQPNTGWMVFDEQVPVAADDEVKDVTDGVRFAGSIDVLNRVASRPPPNLRLLLGYAGWGPGQLESELAQGAWLVAPADHHLVFDVEPDRMWESVLRHLGIEPATLVPTRGVH